MRKTAVNLALASVITLSACAAETARVAMPRSGAASAAATPGPHTVLSVSETRLSSQKAPPTAPVPPFTGRVDTGEIREREVKPQFDRRQNPEEIGRIVSDQDENRILILFNDSYHFRAKKGAGSFHDRNGFGFSVAPGSEPALASLEQLLSRYDVESIRPLKVNNNDTGLEEERLDAIEQETESRLGIDFPHRGSYAILDIPKSKKKTILPLVSALQGLPFVREASVMGTVRNSAVEYYQPPSDPKFPNGADWRDKDLYNSEDVDSNNTQIGSWWWNRHSTLRAWNYTTGGGVKVAVVDSSFKTTINDGINFDLALKRQYLKIGGTVYYSLNVDPETKDVGENLYHGTMVAHAVGAEAGNNEGLCGIAPGVSIIPVKVENDIECVYWGLIYAADAGAKVINLSKGPGPLQNQNWEYETLIRDAFTYAKSKGAIIVYAAGNVNADIPYYGPYYTGAVFVGAINRFNSWWYYDPSEGSNYGTRVDIAAAGDEVSFGANVYVDSLGNLQDRNQVETVTTSGTSLAAPLVAGTMAMVANYVSGTDARERTIDIVLGTADWTNAFGRPMSGRSLYNLDADTQLKTKILNAGSAVRVAYSYTPSIPYQVYRPASDDYTQIHQISGGTTLVNGWYPANFLVGLSGGTVQTNTYNDAGTWADSTIIFKNQRRYLNRHTGSPRLEDANGNILQATYNDTPDANISYNWVNADQNALY